MDQYPLRNYLFKIVFGNLPLGMSLTNYMGRLKAGPIVPPGRTVCSRPLTNRLQPDSTNQITRPPERYWPIRLQMILVTMLGGCLHRFVLADQPFPVLRSLFFTKLLIIITSTILNSK